MFGCVFHVLLLVFSYHLGFVFPLSLLLSFRFGRLLLFLLLFFLLFYVFSLFF